MEKLLYIMLIWVVSTTSIYSQTVAGKIVDESNQPIEFANIVCLSLPDSTFIYGTISDQDLPYPKIHLKGYYAFHL